MSPISAAAPVLETVDVAVHYGGIKAVDGISISLTHGHIFGILGPNGSGKTTLLAAITRLAPLTRGDLLFAGSSYSRVSPHRVARLGVARTFQTVRLIADRTVLDNIRLAVDVPRRGRSRSSRDEDVAQAIERIGVGDLLANYPDELSYGAQRRVEIARALASQPRLLLLDEPTAGMNRDERAEIGELLTRLSSEGLTQLLIEHDVQMMVDTCDYLYAMNFGRLIASGKPEDVVRDEGVQEAYLGKAKGSRDA
ncbi:ABC transporter ATP-binding protein [Microbacterium sp. zg.B48]|uniref:ABC transporter ATP-binding protein n=1 Tax=Microbacterium sp. zg.B48 TaxID=2969408 RepID=UPI00214AD358|nr:ABC transporter ATP-binding protein [Microbacterium sp. zg.B48]MCR2764358.1 ABC transporter ATP-binding protein [Microbacterium sp. zg.B48]